MTAILGISAFYHDSAAVLVVDGELLAAAQEERFTRQKHDARFPIHAIQYCLEEGGLTAKDLSYVGFYDKPLLKFDRLLETYLAYSPRGLQSFLTAIPSWLRQKLHVAREIRHALGGTTHRRLVFVSHHESHAASAFFPAPFEQAAIVTVDGVGEWATASHGHGQGNHITLSHELRFPHSLGMLYSAFTYFCGFEVNSGEYKLMGLAPYGKPKYRQRILERLIDLKPDGSFRMDMAYFHYCQGLRMTSPKLERLLDGPPRRAHMPLTQREMDIAASVQSVTETIMLRIVRHVHERTRLRNLCLAGGVALNCVANGRILHEGPFQRLWIQPAAGDAGGALGVALFIWHQLLGNLRVVRDMDTQLGSLLGPGYSDEQVRSVLDGVEAAYTCVVDEDRLCEQVASYLECGQVVGWFQGRMEFGPRALGNRSILADARNSTMQSVLNQRIKHRESFRPFGPAVLQEHANEYFELGAQTDSPYMMLAVPVASKHRLEAKDDDSHGLDQIKAIRSTIPAATHIDYTARVQTVDQTRNPRYHKLLKVFQQRTGCPILVNTSFNVRDEPIVCTPADAYRCFMATGMDVLIMGNYVLLKSEQRA